MKDGIELYVLVTTDFGGEVNGFPKGGGSSTQPRIKAYDSLASAKRGNARHSGRIAKVIGLELVE